MIPELLRTSWRRSLSGSLAAKLERASICYIHCAHHSSEAADCLAMGGRRAPGDGLGPSGGKGGRGHEMTFDPIVKTASSDEGFDLDGYLGLLDVHGKEVV